MPFVCLTVSNSLEVVNRVHNEWDARLLFEYSAFERNQRFPPSIISNNYGPYADQATVPIGQEPSVRHPTADVS